MTNQSEDDAAFFEMVHTLVEDHGLLKDESSQPGKERRTEERIPFDAIQMIAPYEGASLPAQSQFRHVRFYDLSARGFSFLDSPRPTFPFVVALFGQLPFKIFIARVAHIMDTPRPGTFKIGCEINRRLKE